jgi:predicted nucleic acid-binding Zn ribbon protein
MTWKPPDRVGDLVGPYLARNGLLKRLDLASAVERWPSAVGEQIGSVTRALGVSADGIMWVRVVSSAWASELSLMAPRILVSLNEGRKGRIRELRYVVGPVREG